MSAEPPVATGRWLAAAALAVAVRPSLWPVAVRQVGRLAAPRWWRRPPFLPLPGPDYLRFRFETAYGDRSRGPAPGDVVAYLRWCRSWPFRSERSRSRPGIAR